MASILSSTRVEPLFDDGTAPAVSTAPSTGVEQTLAKLAHKAASQTPDHAAPDRATLDPATLRPADLRAQIPREPRSRGKGRTLARVAIVVCLGVAALWAWRSYGGPAREVIATLAAPFGLTSARPAVDRPPVAPTPDPAPTQAAAPPMVAPVAVAASSPPAQTIAPAPSAAPTTAAADHQQIDAMARDVAALRQTIEQLVAGQEQLKGELAKLEAEKVAAEKPPIEKPKKRVVHHVPAAVHYPDAFDPAQNPSAPGAPRTIGSVVVRRGAAPSTPGVSTLGPLPPPQTPAAPRPPMPLQP